MRVREHTAQHQVADTDAVQREVVGTLALVQKAIARETDVDELV